MFDYDKTIMIKMEQQKFGTGRSETVRSLTPVYDENHRLMTRLIPGIRTIRIPTTLILSNLPRIHLSILECSRYTSTGFLCHCFGAAGSRLLRDLGIKFRMYHDARMLEVLAYQGRSRFLPFYPYPNKAMLSPFEKRQVNLFLGEWLRSCERNGYRFEYHPDGRNVSSYC